MQMNSIKLRISCLLDWIPSIVETHQIHGRITLKVVAFGYDFADEAHAERAVRGTFAHEHAAEVENLDYPDRMC